MKKKFVFTILCLLFITICVCVIINKEMFIDIYGYNFISGFINDDITSFFKIFTHMGSVAWIIGLLVLLLIFIRNNNIRICILCNLIFGVILNNIILKKIFKRSRPIGNRLINISGYSFPSGHSMVSMIFYGYLIYLVYTYIKDKKLKWFLIIVLSLIILAIGVSRIYLGVHYTSDVIGGFVIGIIYLMLFVDISNNILKKYNF